MKIHFFLALFLVLAVSNSLVYGASDLKAVQCVESFIQTYQKIKSYETTLQKKEWNESGKLIHEEKILVRFEKPQNISMTYLDEGSTGIRNNGMTIRFNGGDRISVQLGEPRGLGIIVNKAASLKLKNGLSIYDSDVLDNEIFTIHHAAFEFFAKALDKQLKAGKTDPSGDLKLVESEEPCQIKYVPTSTDEFAEEVEPTDDIISLEKKYGTLSYAIYQRNKDQFDSFLDFFHRNKKMKVFVPKSFLEFNLNIDLNTKLPKEFVLFIKNQKIGQYVFENTRVLEMM